MSKIDFHKNYFEQLNFDRVNKAHKCLTELTKFEFRTVLVSDKC